MIHFTGYANNKFSVLEEHAFLVSRDTVIGTVEDPESVDMSKMPLYIARKTTDECPLKVVYKKEGGMIKIITFYPFRENNHEKE